MTGQDGEVGSSVGTDYGLFFFFYFILIMVLRMALPGDKVARSGYA